MPILFQSQASEGARRRSHEAEAEGERHEHPEVGHEHPEVGVHEHPAGGSTVSPAVPGPLKTLYALRRLAMTPPPAHTYCAALTPLAWASQGGPRRDTPAQW